MQIFPEALSAAEDVVKGIKGRAADLGVALPWIASMAIAAGPGDHVEIGTLFGASAITVALAKQRVGLPGKVYCIDPFEPRKEIAFNSSLVPKELRDGTPEIVMENAAAFGVELEIIKKPSIPWPEELRDKMFASAYIDGWHVGDTPYQDFLNLADRVEKYIGFDNYEEAYPDVVRAVHKAILGPMNWFLFFKQISFVAVRRRLGPRTPGVTMEML